jgi:hypothetical protein
MFLLFSPTPTHKKLIRSSTLLPGMPINTTSQIYTVPNLQPGTL